MIVFLFYLVAILAVLTFCAGVADAIGHFFPDWLDPEQAAPKQDGEEETR